MYYIAGLTKNVETACDFGFDMLERIILDDVLIEAPKGMISRLVTRKQFSYFGDKPDVPLEEWIGQKYQVLQIKYGIKNDFQVLRENCQAVIVESELFLALLKRMRIKLMNLSCWQADIHITPVGLFNHIVLYHPQILRELLGKEKYGVWNHNTDQIKAVRVLDKFIGFLDRHRRIKQLIIYNELTCPHWDATGSMHFDREGRLVSFNYFGKGNGQSYRYYPQLEVWQRRQ